MDTDKKTFAFRLAEQTRSPEQPRWDIRDGVATAGCTDPTHQGDYRYSTTLGRDNGAWC